MQNIFYTTRDSALYNMRESKHVFRNDGVSLADAVCLSAAKISASKDGESRHSRSRGSRGRQDTRVGFKAEDEHDLIEYESFHSSLKDQIWYNADDFIAMKQGQDEFLKQRRKHVAGIRRCFVRSILELQDEHRREGVLDPKGIACVSRSSTKYSRRDAEKRAKDLEQEIGREDRMKTLNMLDEVLDILDFDTNRRTGPDKMLKPPRRSSEA